MEPVEGHAIQGLKNMTESMVPGIFAAGELDDRRLVDDGEAFDDDEAAGPPRRGCSSAPRAARPWPWPCEIAAEIDAGTIVVLLPDRGDRYLSTMQFRSICAKCPRVTAAGGAWGR